MSLKLSKGENVLQVDDAKGLKFRLYEKTDNTMDDDHPCAGLDRIETWGYNPIFKTDLYDYKMETLWKLYSAGKLDNENYHNAINYLSTEETAREMLRQCLYEVYIGLFKKRELDNRELFLERVHNFMLWFEENAKELEVYEDIDYNYANKLLHNQPKDLIYEFGTREYMLSYYKKGVSGLRNRCRDNFDELDFRAVFWDYSIYSDYLSRIETSFSLGEKFNRDEIERCLSRIFLYLSAKRVNEGVNAFVERVCKFCKMKEIQLLRIWGSPMVV